jgi:hypothetical protein
MAVDGENDHGSLPLTSDLALSASAANQTLSVVGALPFTVRIDKDGCQELKGSVSGLFAGSSPWVQADQ